MTPLKSCLTQSLVIDSSNSKGPDFHVLTPLDTSPNLLSGLVLQVLFTTMSTPTKDKLSSPQQKVVKKDGIWVIEG